MTQSLPKRRGSSMALASLWSSPAAERSSAEGEALLRFAENAVAPVATTSMGKGAIPETHPLAMGVIGNLTGPGGLGRHTKPLVQQADLVMLIGNRTNEDGTDRWSLI
jgi:acetolactate synthase-1/2/3 large subunit